MIVIVVYEETNLYPDVLCYVGLLQQDVTLHYLVMISCSTDILYILFL
ncbi:hypothetical protein PsAD37_02070 [Pseudovibrio sp. Ad37]|nr:hypothetical protein PsAD37_02070 [Pseudovibrio sp. Ad37]